jgi:3-oxoacyl-[acyl-carrier protein] reductase
MEIHNKVALITGTKRIGSVVGVQLAERGADVALTYNRSKGEAEETARTIRSRGRKAMSLQADLSQDSQVRAWLNM